MDQPPHAIGLVVAGLLFVTFLLVKLLSPLVPAGGAGRARAARREVAEAKRRSRDRNLPTSERAAALREAAVSALEGMGRPGLAASFARRAERLDPAAPGSIGLLATAMRRAARYRALERILWRRLASSKSNAIDEQALSELLSLYDGPLQRPEIAEALRRLRGA